MCTAPSAIPIRDTRRMVTRRLRGMADVVIIGAIALGAIVGWRKGFVLPLISLGGALLSIATLYAGPLNGMVPSGNAGLGVLTARLRRSRT